MLTRLLYAAGIERSQCFLTNVFNFHPRGDDIDEVLGPESTALAGYPAHHGAKYVQRRYAPDLDRLNRELSSHKPNILILLGNTAMWAMLGRSGVAKWRGTTELSTHTCEGIKCISTYHPAAVAREYSLRATVVLDLQKAERQSHFPDLRRPKRELWIEPTLRDLEVFYERYIEGCEVLVVDIETYRATVTTVGFAPRPDLALVVPFYDFRRKDRSYWHTSGDELVAWKFVKRVLQSNQIRKCFQNGLYDISFLWRAVGIKVRSAEHDTMLLHHSLQPESLKGLGYLGSIYSNECAWKSIFKGSTTIKGEA
jgi:uracil-DNA glycosylase